MKRWWIQPFVRIVSALSLPILVPVAITYVIFAMPGGPAEIICPSGKCSPEQIECLSKQLHVDKGAWNYFKFSMYRAIGNQEKGSDEVYFAGSGDVELFYHAERDAKKTKMSLYNSETCKLENVDESFDLMMDKQSIYQYCSDEDIVNPNESYCFGKRVGKKKRVDGKQVRTLLKKGSNSFTWTPAKVGKYGMSFLESKHQGLYRFELQASDDNGPINVEYQMPTTYYRPQLGKSTLHKKPITELIFGSQVKPKNILLAVTQVFGDGKILTADLRSPNFESHRVPKLLSMWFMQKYTDLELTKIGQMHGLQEEAKIKQGLSQISDKIDTDDVFRSKAKTVQDIILKSGDYREPALYVSIQMLLISVGIIAFGSLLGGLSFPKPKWDPILLVIGVIPILFMGLLASAILELNFKDHASLDFLKLLFGGLSLGLADAAFTGAITGVRGAFNRENKERYVGVSVLRGERNISNTLPNVAQALVGQFRSRVLLLLSGLVIVEVILNTEGMGQLLWESTVKQDYGLALWAATFFAVISSVLLLLQAIVEIVVALHIRKSPKGVVSTSLEAS